MKRINFYVIRLTLGPQLAALCIAVTLLVLDQLVRLAEFVARQAGGVGTLLEMLALLLPEYVGLALPISLMLGILLAIRRLSLNSELDSMFAGGVSMQQLLRPLMVLSAGVAILTFAVVGYLYPYSIFVYHKMAYELGATALTGSLSSGKFVSVVGSGVLHVDNVRQGGVLDGVFFEQCDSSSICTVTTARSGRLIPTQDKHGLILILPEGRQLRLSPNGAKVGQLRVESQRIIVPLPKLEPFRKRGGHRQEATFGELLRVVQSQEPAHLYALYRAELHWRITYALTCLMIPFLGISLGAIDKRDHAATGPIVGLALIIAYIEALGSSQIAVAKTDVSPWLVMWPLLGLLGAISVLFFWISSERPGGHPLRMVEYFVSAVEARVKPCLRRFVRAWDAVQ